MMFTKAELLPALPYQVLLAPGAVCQLARHPGRHEGRHAGGEGGQPRLGVHGPREGVLEVLAGAEGESMDLRVR